MAKHWGNIFGAFADGAILFPLIAVLSASAGFSTATLFASAGMLYLFSGAWFRLPMPVQPLKAIAIAAIVLGASALEIRCAGAIIGLFCLLLLAVKADRMAKYVPTFLIHGIQAGLGVLLLSRAVEMGWAEIPKLEMARSGFILLACLMCWVVARRFSFSALGLLAATGTLFSLTASSSAPTGVSGTFPPFRWELVLALALPQIVLTTANSVLATEQVAERYFGERARRVTISRLLSSIGWGNLVVSLFGGLPFCHGSGGMTAHVRGGSTHWSSNFVIGAFLIGLAAIQWWGGYVQPIYPPLLLAILLGTVGFYHLKLAAPSWEIAAYRPTLVAMGIVVLLTKSLLWALFVGTITALLSRVALRRETSA